MKALAEELTPNQVLNWNTQYNYTSKISFSLESGQYILKTAEKAQELFGSFRLRHDVFVNELQGKSVGGLDFDQYDFSFDHLIIIHKNSGHIVGTYRLNCIDNNRTKIYTSNEFFLDQILEERGPLLELGRACIHKDHRKGTVLSLLWKGITEYMNLSGATMLFGCSSLQLTDPRQAALIYFYMDMEGHMSDKYSSHPKEKYEVPYFDNWLETFAGHLTKEQIEEAKTLVPPLLRAYLKHGAKIVGRPALDSEFQCLDFLTVLNREDMAATLARRLNVIQ